MLPPIPVAALALVSACAPIVTHGPRVDPGLTAVATVGVPGQLCDSSCALELIPQYGLGLRYGREPLGRSPGYSVAGTLSAALASSELDVYVQAPLNTERWAAGAGVLAAMTHAMPYVQLGEFRRSGWYTTQGLAMLVTRPEDMAFFGGGGEDVRPVYWAPTLAYRAYNRRGALHVYVSGAFGRADRLAYDTIAGGSRRVGSQPVRVVMFGLTVEERLPDPFYRGPGPAPRPVPPPRPPIPPAP